MTRLTNILVAACALSVLFASCEGRRLSANDKKAEEPEVFYNTAFPYACTVNITTSKSYCSGVLVNSSWVATAAHCVDDADAKELIVLCDASDTKNVVVEIVIHEEWLSIPRLEYDVAMLKLKTPSELPVVDLAIIEANLTLGYLYAYETDNKDITVQTQTDVSYVNHTVCNSYFDWTQSIEETVFCAAAEEVCISDGGSALYFQPFNSSFPPLLYGIASFDTKQCDRHGFPIVYTSVVSHYYWFQAVIVGNVTSTPAEPDAEYYDELKLNITKTYEGKKEKVLVEAAKSAIIEDDAFTLSVLLDLGLSPNAKVDDLNRTLLHFCATQNAYECSLTLIDAGANHSILEDGAGATPLHFAALNGSIAVANVLLEAGAYVNDVDVLHRTPLLYVVTIGKPQLTMMLFLLEKGANVHEKDNIEATPLHYAAASNWVSGTLVLIQAGSNLVEFADDNGTPLHWAARAGSDDTVRILIKDTDIEAKPKRGLKETALSFAVRNKAPLSTIQILVTEGGANVNVVDAKKKTPLHRAARNNDVPVIEFLIENGANMISKNFFGNRPVDVFCKFYACYSKKHESTRLLLTP